MSQSVDCVMLRIQNADTESWQDLKSEMLLLPSDRVERWEVRAKMQDTRKVDGGELKQDFPAANAKHEHKLRTGEDRGGPITFKMTQEVAKETNAYHRDLNFTATYREHSS